MVSLQITIASASLTLAREANNLQPNTMPHSKCRSHSRAAKLKRHKQPLGRNLAKSKTAQKPKFLLMKTANGSATLTSHWSLLVEMKDNSGSVIEYDASYNRDYRVKAKKTTWASMSRTKQVYKTWRKKTFLRLKNYL